MVAGHQIKLVMSSYTVLTSQLTELSLDELIDRTEAPFSVGF